MELWEVLNNVKEASGLSDRAISKRMSRSDGYYSALKAQRNALQVNTCAKILKACGYALVAVREDDIPNNAYIFTAKD